jgi:hypothetical protein
LDPQRPGVLIIRMPSSYVYLSGTLDLAAVVPAGGQIIVSFSDNNGLDWTPIKNLTRSGTQTIDLKALVFRRYDYQLEFELSGAGTGLDRISVRHDIQHSQRPLPALTQGQNTITFSADAGNCGAGFQPAAPAGSSQDGRSAKPIAEGTITFEGSTLLKNRGKQVLYTDYHPQQENIGEPMISVKGAKGSITFPVTTPGAMRRLRLFAFYRARAEGDHWVVSVSFDGGKTFQDVGHLDGPFRAMGQQFAIDAPPRTTSALVRFTGTRVDEAMLFNVRIDADYEEPHGGFRPIKITYLWEESGQPRQDIHIARTPSENYVINCGSKPTMKSIILETAE